ncbi:MAG: DUF3987 domain-containing protein [Prevotella sp.]|nr:DUF3987 domain-containing protein [Prevotella sp.]
MNQNRDIATSLAAEILKEKQDVTDQNVLPLDGFSDDAQSIIREFAARQGTNTNYTASVFLCLIGALAGKNLKSIYDWGNKNWPNYGQLFVCMLGGVSQGKSPALREFMEAIEDLDDEWDSKYIEYYKTWKNECKLAAQKKEEEPEKPTRTKLRVIGTTPEGLKKVMSENQKGIILVEDELIHFHRTFDKFSKGDSVGDLVKAWGCQTIDEDRAREDHPYPKIRDPFLSFIAGTQPDNLASIFGKYIPDGYPQRWLFVFPNEKEQWSEGLGMGQQKWRRIVDSILRMQPSVFRFDQYSAVLLEKFDEDKGKEVQQQEYENKIYAEFVDKTSYYVRRIAGIVHLIAQGTDITHSGVYPAITREETEFAIRLMNFYKGQFLRATEYLSNKPSVKKPGKGEVLRLLNEYYKITERGMQSQLAKALGINPGTVCEAMNKK